MSVGRSSAITDTGRKRRRNEDAFVCEPPLFAVADGMGGAKAGEVASQIAASSLRERGEAEPTPEQQVVELIREANRRIYAYSSENVAARGMGTTMTVALVTGPSVSIGHVGDSRAYLLRQSELRQVTHDHSLVAELVRSGRLSPEEAETHPQRSVITRALGTDPEIEVDVFSLRLEDGDLFLLCSDGLTSMLDDDRIGQILREQRGDLDAASRALVEAANRAGGEDNITVVLFEAELTETDLHELVEEEKTLTELEAVPALRIEEPEQPPRHSRARRRVLLLGLVAAVLAAAAALGAWALSWSHFVGVEPDGHVAVYQGIPYDLPGGIHLYRPVHVSGRLLAAELRLSERRQLFDHALTSATSANRALRQAEEAVNP
jgi:serine/threonine protein phosphatase PrpC